VALASGATQPVCYALATKQRSAHNAHKASFTMPLFLSVSASVPSHIFQMQQPHLAVPLVCLAHLHATLAILQTANFVCPATQVLSYRVVLALLNAILPTRFMAIQLPTNALLAIAPALSVILVQLAAPPALLLTTI
jgi:hypothetical protein